MVRAVARLRSGANVGARWEALSASLQVPANEQAVVDSGRVRLFVAVDDPSTVHLPPAEVIAFCAEHALSGVCVYHQNAEGDVRLRVFTVSLGGAEDLATGGAVLGLSRLIADGNEPIAVLQGDGSDAWRAGQLWLRHRAHEDAVAVGGRVQLVSHGQLLM